jgi:hypothetical protein
MTKETISPTPGQSVALFAAGPLRIKLIARNKILAVLPEWKQVNMTARSVELTRAGLAGNLTAGEQAEEAAIQAAWDWVKSVRAHSDTMEAAYEAAEDKQGFDYMAGWPNFHMEEPVPVEIPDFLLEPEVPEAVEEPETVPPELLDLVRENEPYGDTRERLWSVFVSIQHKLADDGKTMPKATSEEVLLYTRLYPHMGWLAKPGAVEVI